MSSAFPPLEPRGSVLGDEVYQLLGQAIIDGTLAPGQRLRDQDLAADLGVSRTPVREALQRLEFSGVVEVLPARFTRVSAPTDKSQSDLFELVGYLMGITLHMSLARCDEETHARLVGEADTLVAASLADDYEALIAASIDFFTQLTFASGNTAVLKFMREAQIAIRRNLRAWRPGVACPVHRSDLYQQFRDAVARRDATTGEAVLREIHGLGRAAAETVDG